MTSPAPSRPRGEILAKIGAWLQAAQIVGFVGTLIGMNRAFAAMGERQVTEPGTLSTVIGGVLFYSFIGIGLAVVGLILVIIAATIYKYRAGWFFWFMCIYGTGAVFSYMLPLALFLVIYALVKKKEFQLEPSIPFSPFG